MTKPQAPAIPIPKVTITPGGQPPGTPPMMTSAPEAARLREELAAVIETVVADNLPYAPGGAAARARDAVSDFFALYPKRPVTDNKGGSGFNDSLWLYALARAFAPRLIIESGTFQGHSAWLFHQACPDAEIHTFDIDPTRLAHRTPGVTYYRHDWTEAKLPAPPETGSLVFLDDHISHAKRIVEAHARGFRLLLVDDNFPAQGLYATGGPPVPTLAMITDPELHFGQELSWVRKGKAYAYTYREEDEAGAGALIEHYLMLPDLAPITRYPAGSGLSLVRLRD